MSLNNPSRLKYLKAELQRATNAAENKDYIRGLKVACEILFDGIIPEATKQMDDDRIMAAAAQAAEIERSARNKERETIQKAINEKAKGKPKPGQSININTFKEVYKPAQEPEPQPERIQPEPEKIQPKKRGKR